MGKAPQPADRRRVVRGSNLEQTLNLPTSSLIVRYDISTRNSLHERRSSPSSLWLLLLLSEALSGGQHALGLIVHEIGE